MLNRSISKLPAFFEPAVSNNLDQRNARAYPLVVYEITYLHCHAQLELGVCVSGRGVCVVEGVEYPFRAGDVQIIFPFQNHLSRSEGDADSLWYWVSLDPARLISQWNAATLPRLEKLLNTGMGLCGIMDREKYPLAAQLIERVTLPGERPLRLQCLCALIEVLAENSSGMEKLKLRPENSFERLEPALRLAEEKLDGGELPQASDMAVACRLSDASLRRAFQQVLGQSPQRYIQASQMRRAQHLLLFSDRSVTDIAQAVGYQDASGFNRLFKRWFGMSPREYRNQRK